MVDNAEASIPADQFLCDRFTTITLFNGCSVEKLNGKELAKLRQTYAHEQTCVYECVQITEVVHRGSGWHLLPSAALTQRPAFWHNQLHSYGVIGFNLVYQYYAPWLFARPWLRRTLLLPLEACVSSVLYVIAWIKSPAITRVTTTDYERLTYTPDTASGKPQIVRWSPSVPPPKHARILDGYFFPAAQYTHKPDESVTVVLTANLLVFKDMPTCAVEGSEQVAPTTIFFAHAWSKAENDVLTAYPAIRETEGVARTLFCAMASLYSFASATLSTILFTAANSVHLMRYNSCRVISDASRMSQSEADEYVRLWKRIDQGGRHPHIVILTRVMHVVGLTAAACSVGILGAAAIGVFFIRRHH